MTVKEILEATEGQLVQGNPEAVVAGISTDTRKLKKGDLFVPLCGKSFDGHAFIAEALSRGAAAVLSSRPPATDAFPGALIQVEDTLMAFHLLARAHRMRFPVPVVAITGSCGKTSTKDYTAHVLSGRFRTLCSKENFNNEYGVPMTMLELAPEHEVLVLEMAMRGRGQIRELAETARPTIGVITNVGESHHELLGSTKDIALAKRELLEAMDPAGTAVLNGDDPLVSSFREVYRGRTLMFGFGDSPISASNLVPGSTGTRFTLTFEGDSRDCRVPILGAHSIRNILAAAGVALVLGMDLDSICFRLGTIKPSARRLERLKTRAGWTLLDDSYNANPQSVAEALSTLKLLPVSGRRIAVLGDMLELGKIAGEAHGRIGRLVLDAGVDALHTVGSLGSLITESAVAAGLARTRAGHWDDKEALVKELFSCLSPDDVVLVKGSRGMRLDEVSDSLLALGGGAAEETGV
ncbi:MAG: UDP-N-acetylmuramoyl-tripeptide--D-alanyl-D-alanine ligase [Armatimonadetes bacterium]|nr:UDP-N-acetylmuramoyl-tripeptide--D-alanyl-D-alanine ligase [Armatimonadota bacterium]